eukprot:g55551.t1
MPLRLDTTTTSCPATAPTTPTTPLSVIPLSAASSSTFKSVHFDGSGIPTLESVEAELARLRAEVQEVKTAAVTKSATYPKKHSKGRSPRRAAGGLPPVHLFPVIEIPDVHVVPDDNLAAFFGSDVGSEEMGTVREDENAVADEEMRLAYKTLLRAKKK